MTVSPAEQAELLEMAAEHVRRLSDSKGGPATNHGLFELRGLMLLCRVLGKAAGCENSRAFLQAHVAELLDQQFTARGVHREHSPSYHKLAIVALESLADPEGEGVYKDVADRLALAREVWPWLVFPWGRVAALGDSEGEVEVTPPSAQKCQPDSKQPCVEVGDFAQDGYVVVRSPWSRARERAFMLIMTGSFNSGTHKHADDLSFGLMEGGQMLFVDAGKYSYTPNQLRKFVTSARAHNAIGLATRELGATSSERHATALAPPVSGDAVYTLNGRVRYRKLFTQRRRLEYSPGRYLLIHDELSSPKPLSYESYLHLAPDLIPQRVGDAFVVTLADGRRLRIESIAPHCVARVERGLREGKRLQGWVSERYGSVQEASAITFACGENPSRISLLASFDAASRKAALASLAKPGLN